jgi:restriction endonuclease S subunit
MDVYTNDYVTDDLPFMEATASESEIRRFSVMQGDIIITKDSETPDDIGVPAIVADNVRNLVCGYHLALIRPQLDCIDPTFLCKLIGHDAVARYYARHANGMTRYGLSTGTVENTPLVLPDNIDEQRAVGNVLKMLDKIISQTEAIIAKYKRIKQGLMQDLLTKGIDERGSVRSDKTHKFKHSHLGPIPVDWEVRQINHIATVLSGGTPSTNKLSYWKGDIVWLTPDDLSGGAKHVSDSYRKISDSGLSHSSAKMIPAQSIVVSSRAPIGYLAIVTVPFSTNQGCKSLVLGKDESSEFHYYNLHTAISRMIAVGSGTTFTEITKTQLETLFIKRPQPSEQKRIAKKLSGADKAIVAEEDY